MELRPIFIFYLNYLRGAYSNQIVLVKEIWERMLKKLEDVAMASLHLESTYNRLSTSFAKLTESIQSLDVTERGFANYTTPSKPCTNYYYENQEISFHISLPL